METKENNFFQKIFLLTLFFLICLWSTWINRLPNGYMVSQGDEPTRLNLSQSYKGYFYLWGYTGGGGDNRGAELAPLPENGFYYLLEKLGLTVGQRQNVKYFLFYFFSGLAAYFAIGLFLGVEVPLLQFLAACFYAFNSFTVMAAIRMGFYYPYFNSYIFLPLAWAFFTRGLIDHKKYYLVFFILLTFISGSGFGHPAFLVLYFSLMAVTAVFLWLKKWIKFRQVILAAFTLILASLTLSYYLFHYGINLLLFARGQVESSLTGGSLEQRILDMSGSLTSPLRLHIGGPGFPDVFPYRFLPKWFFFGLSYYPLILIIVAFLLVKNKNFRSWLVFTGIIFLISTFGTVKAGISRTLSLKIFALPILNYFRSNEKFIILIPWTILIFLVIFFEELTESLKNRTKMIGLYLLAFLIIFLTSLPLFTGKLNQNFTIAYLWEYKYDVKVKIPDYYRELADFVNKDSDYYKILLMPFGGQTGTGWTLYPKWKFHGANPYFQYFRNPLYAPINSSTQFKEAVYIYNNPQKSEKLFLPLLQSKGIRYLIINKDTDDQYLQSFNQLFNKIKSDFIFIRSFGNLDLYRIAPEKEWPVIYPLKGEENPSLIRLQGLKGNFRGYFDWDEAYVRKRDISARSKNIPTITFKKISPVKYLLDIKGAKEPFWLIFSDTYNSHWKLFNHKTNLKNELYYLFSKPLNLSQVMINDFANGWYIDPPKLNLEETFQLELYYLPQLVFYFGMATTLLVVFFCFYCLLIWSCGFRTFFKTKSFKNNRFDKHEPIGK